jgi:hypothetical protein
MCRKRQAGALFTPTRDDISPWPLDCEAVKITTETVRGQMNQIAQAAAARARAWLTCWVTPIID